MVRHRQTWAGDAKRGRKRRRVYASLLQVDGLVSTVLVELSTPNLVHALMFGLSEADWRPQAKVDCADTLKRGHQSFGIKLGTVAFQGLYHELADNITLEGDIVRLFARKILPKCRFVLEHERRVSLDCGHDLRHDDTGCKSLTQKHQLIRESGASNERHACVDHVRIEVARLFYEFRRRAISWHHDHSSDRNATFPELLDGLVHVHSVPLIV